METSIHNVKKAISFLEYLKSKEKDNSVINNFNLVIGTIKSLSREYQGMSCTQKMVYDVAAGELKNGGDPTDNLRFIEDYINGNLTT